jgi:pathogenesis-related protein 1
MARWSLVLALLQMTCPSPAAATSIEQQMLDAQNAVRARVGVRPLVWSDKLTRVAQEWADRLVKEGSVRHRPNSPWGQNLYDVTGSEYLPQQIVNGWAAEAKDFDVAANKCKEGRMCGHYTQLVWRDTKQVGCPVARGGNREVWVCEYSPPGNYAGMRPY